MVTEDELFQAKIPWKFNAATALVDANVAQGRGDSVAVYYQDQTITYRDIQRMINKVGNALSDLGVEIENRVAILLPDCPQWVASFFGAMKIGAVPVPLNTMMHSGEYQYFLNDSRAKTIIVSDDLLPQIEAIRDDLRYLKHIIVVGEARGHQLDYDELVDAASSELEVADTCQDDAAYWLYTSGSTGPPKGVIHLHHDLLHAPEFGFKTALGGNDKDIVFCVPRLFFHYGLTVLAATFYVGASRVLDSERPRPERVFEIITRYKPSFFGAVPTFFASMLALKDSQKCDLGSMRICLSAGEPLPPILFTRFKERFGVEILDWIGLTEGCCWQIGNRPGRVKVGSTGELAPGCEAKLVDDQLQEVPHGEIGVLMVKAGSVAAGYWNKHERTKEMFIGNWLWTGDRFYQDEEGYFWFKGRVDDVIEAGAIKVIPTEVEAVLLEHPAVVEAAVVGAPDEYGLTKPKAFVALGQGYKPSPELVKELQQFVKTKIAPYNYPRWVDFMDELPKTATGKIQRFKLR